MNPRQRQKRRRQSWVQRRRNQAIRSRTYREEIWGRALDAIFSGQEGRTWSALSAEDRLVSSDFASYRHWLYPVFHEERTCPRNPPLR